MSNFTTNDLTTTVEGYIENGWFPLPLPAGQKQPPPLKSTGNVPELSDAQIQAIWESAPENCNVGLRLRDDVIAIDVDNPDLFRQFIDDNGLDAHGGTVYNTRHGADSERRHWFLRVPTGFKWVSKFPGGEVLQMTHRYAVVYPSVVDGLQYKWYSADGNEMDTPPSVDDLPELPEAWIETLMGDGSVEIREYVRPDSLDKAEEWLEANTVDFLADEPDKWLVERLENLDFSDGAHPVMNSTVQSFVCEAVEKGRTGADAALESVREAYKAEVMSRRLGDPGRLSAGAADAKFDSSLGGAVAKIRKRIKDEEITPWLVYVPMIEKIDWDEFARKLSDGSWLSRPEIKPDAPEDLEAKRVAAVAAVEASAPEDYWQKYPVLAEIAHYATRAAVDKYSLLFRVLTYLSSEMPPTVYLEDIGQPLTLYSAVIAESGAGKGVLDKVADALVSQRLYNGDPVLRPGTGNMHTLLTALGDFTLPPLDKETGEQTMPMKKHRMLIQGNELAAWAEMQGNAEWAGTMADVFDGRGDYQVRNEGNRYHFGLDQHSLAVTFSVQPDAARYLFASTGRGLPGRFLISALPPQGRVLPEDFDPWDLDSEFEVDTFDPARDVSRLKINSRFFLETGPFHLSDDARKANARLKRAWDEGVRENRRLREEKIFSQMPKVRLRVAVLLSVLLDLGEGREVPLEALKMADFLLKVSVENTRYARSLADRAERKVNAAVAATRKRADADADLSLAKENVLSVIDKSKSGKAGLGRINDRKRVTAEHHPAAIAELVVEGVLEVIKTPKAPDAYKRG